MDRRAQRGYGAHQSNPYGVVGIQTGWIFINNLLLLSL